MSGWLPQPPAVSLRSFWLTTSPLSCLLGLQSWRLLCSTLPCGILGSRALR